MKPTLSTAQLPVIATPASAGRVAGSGEDNYTLAANGGFIMVVER